MLRVLNSKVRSACYSGAGGHSASIRRRLAHRTDLGGRGFGRDVWGATDRGTASRAPRVALLRRRRRTYASCGLRDRGGCRPVGGGRNHRDPVAHLPNIYARFRELVSAMEARRPEVAVVIDSPAFRQLAGCEGGAPARHSCRCTTWRRNFGPGGSGGPGLSAGMCRRRW